MNTLHILGLYVQDLATLSSLFPSLLCAAAKENDLEALEKLRKVVSIQKIGEGPAGLYGYFHRLPGTSAIW